jgi:hypothetical protein
MAAILIIYPQMHRLLARTLTGAGHTGHQAKDGRVGMVRFDRMHPVPNTALWTYWRRLGPVSFTGRWRIERSSFR